MNPPTMPVLHLLRLALLVPLLAATCLAGPDHDHGAAIRGPNEGRVLTGIEPHVELFVTAERTVVLTPVDDAGKAVALPEGWTITLVTGERSAPVTLQFERGPVAWRSASPLPAGESLPAILRIRTSADAPPTTLRLQLNLAKCPTCERAEYACSCEHGH
jgi:hypothetical protein